MSEGLIPSRAELLRLAAGVLLSRMPTWQARFLVRGHPFRARWEWPGVVTVSAEHSGELLARSEPGRPATPDAETLALAPLRLWP